uniref:rRNA biogenesis protein RRP36 n=1 Tax=Sinocyclocheilus rhinocerous TaxID=307959 RepID=A0A673NGA4_9TELE
MPKSAKKLTKMEHQSSDDEEDVLEMERNFAVNIIYYVGAILHLLSCLCFCVELSTLSFEEIMKLQNKVGTKAYNKIAYGATKPQKKTEPMKRLTKHRYLQCLISAKKHVPFLRKVVPVKKRISRDPRFDDLSGEYKPEIFSRTYKFINDIRQKETKIVRKKLGKAKSDTKKEELKALLKRMENQQRARQRQEHEREKELHFKQKQRELVGQGHKPFYLKKSDKKKLELAEKYSELKKSGKLENFLSKKRKRNATKDRKKLPNQHKKRHIWTNHGSSVAP